jgi:small GTP-binding protein
MAAAPRECASTKVVLIGDSGVGKSALFRAFQKCTFTHGLPETVGNAYANVIVTLEDGTAVSLKIWDTAGQETYRSIIPMYFSECQFILLVYEIPCHASFANLQAWVTLARDKAPRDAKFVLIGNKSDLESSRQVPFGDASEYANSLSALGFFETSALNGNGIEAVMQSVATEAVAPSQTANANRIDANASPSKRSCC